MSELTREQQIAIMEGAPERMDAYARKWLDDPAFRAALRRHCGKDTKPLDTPERQGMGR